MPALCLPGACAQRLALRSVRKAAARLRGVNGQIVGSCIQQFLERDVLGSLEDPGMVAKRGGNLPDLLSRCPGDGMGIHLASGRTSSVWARDLVASCGLATGVPTIHAK